MDDIIDIIILSERSKQMGIIELTVPSEERVEVSGELKRDKYETLAEAGKLNGWKVRVWAVEVGCRGFPAVSMATLLRDIGYQGKEKGKMLKQIGEAAETAEQVSVELESLQRMGETRVKENRKRSKHRQVAQAAEGARIGSTTDIPRNCDSNPGL